MSAYAVTKSDLTTRCKHGQCELESKINMMGEDKTTSKKGGKRKKMCSDMQKRRLRLLFSNVGEIKTQRLSTEAHAEQKSEAELRTRVHPDKINAAKPESPSSLIPSIQTPAEVAHLREDSYFHTQVRRYAMFDSSAVFEREIGARSTWWFCIKLIQNRHELKQSQRQMPCAVVRFFCACAVVRNNVTCEFEKFEDGIIIFFKHKINIKYNQIESFISWA